jgi:hypothetical protein
MSVNTASSAKFENNGRHNPPATNALLTVANVGID